MKTLLKVLTKDMRPIIQGGKPNHIGKWYECHDFDESDRECSRGFYGTQVDGLILYHKPKTGTRVFETLFDGKEKIFSPSKQRYSKQMLVKELGRE